ncbi:hypothetical protein [Methylomonas rapida]|uniref:Uncharacterized protein n=1 Tax=Methylomonas rapida TaxID=2963939 RepID=A0ABY7GNC4_9GAMM|nr:hypothetical protein [Methylomonas rapida]WAR46001.1 hypothetical protein NM686_005640 [Methylomonas rapida]
MIVSQILFSLFADDGEFGISCKITSKNLCFNTRQRNRLSFTLPLLPRLSRLIFHNHLDPTSVGVPFLSGDGGFPSACQVRQA